jgi:DNA-binding CsgD family transcriptional regulator
MRSLNSADIDSRGSYASALQSALTLDEVTTAFMTAAEALIGSDVFGVYQFDTSANAVASCRASTSSRFLDAYERYGRADDPVLKFVLTRKEPIDSSRLGTTTLWENSGARAALAIDGYCHSLEAPVIVAGSVFGTINFARRPHRSEFTETDLILAQFASDQLGLAAERALRFEGIGRKANILEDAFDRMPQAVLVTDLESRILFQNRAARSLTSAPQSSSWESLSDLIGEAMQVFRTEDKRVHTRSVKIPAGGELITKSYRLPDSQNAAMTLAYQADGETAKALPVWSVLSRREQEIAELVAQGLTTKQIAEKAFVSENTVKQHLKRIFAKADVHNRAELVQLIWAHGDKSER